MNMLCGLDVKNFIDTFCYTLIYTRVWFNIYVCDNVCTLNLCFLLVVQLVMLMSRKVSESL